MIHIVESIHSALALAIFWGSVAFEAFALADAATRPAQAFVSEGKLTKPAWLLILALALLTCLAFLGPTGIFGLLGLLAASVYMADVRPAVAVRRSRRQ